MVTHIVHRSNVYSGMSPLSDVIIFKASSRRFGGSGVACAASSSGSNVKAGYDGTKGLWQFFWGRGVDIE